MKMETKEVGKDEQVKANRPMKNSTTHVERKLGRKRVAEEVEGETYASYIRKG